MLRAASRTSPCLSCCVPASPRPVPSSAVQGASGPGEVGSCCVPQHLGSAHGTHGSAAALLGWTGGSVGRGRDWLPSYDFPGPEHVGQVWGHDAFSVPVWGEVPRRLGVPSAPWAAVRPSELGVGRAGWALRAPSTETAP